tara:strand:+ start:368 stop:550 length:183 start_codon:yes stop_codon:yes gene_type:complete
MIDNEHDSIDYTKLAVWVTLFIGCILVWYSIFTNGFFMTLMWLIVSSAVVGIWLKLSGRI